MAGTISSTTKVTKVDWKTVPHQLVAQASDFMDFLGKNGVLEAPFPAVFDYLPVEGYVKQFHLVFENPENDDKFCGISLNVQAEFPNTANADAVEVRAFYGISGPLRRVWASRFDK